MQFALSVNIERICPELVCGLIAIDTVFYEFGEIFHIIEAGSKYVECRLPKDEIVSEHIVDTIKTRLTKDFALSLTPQSLIISWQPA